MNEQNYDEIRKRTARYWYVDGLAEMGLGVIFFVLGISFLLIGFVQPNTPSMILWGVGQPLVVILVAVGVGRAIKALKQRVTFPRTGYVAYIPKSGKRRWLGALVSGVTAAVLSIVMTFLSNYLQANLMIAISGLIFALLCVYLAVQFGLTRFYILGGLVAAWAIAVSIAKPAEPLPSVLLFGGIGLLWIGSGALTLVAYLRSTTPANPEELE